MSGFGGGATVFAASCPESRETVAREREIIATCHDASAANLAKAEFDRIHVRRERIDRTAVGTA